MKENTPTNEEITRIRPPLKSEQITKEQAVVIEAAELDGLERAEQRDDNPVGEPLPVVVAEGQPLAFREWRPDCRWERGVWNIPNPVGTDEVVPDILIAPVVGYDRRLFRLGHGGGFFDRTLAALPSRPIFIGVGHPVAAIATIYPQPHDIPMDMVLTGAGDMPKEER